jgi:hypothetical protein
MNRCMNNLKMSMRDGKWYMIRNGAVIATIDHVMTEGQPKSNSFIVMVRVPNVSLKTLWDKSASFFDIDSAVSYVEGIQS